MPPPFVNTGNPMSPKITYTTMLMLPSLAPRSIPDNATNIHCKVKGTMGDGIVILEPIVIKAVKRDTKVISFVVNFKLIILPIVNFYVCLVYNIRIHSHLRFVNANFIYG